MPFVVGLDGQLVRVELQIWQGTDNGGDLLFDVRPIVAGVPVADDSAALATAVLTSADVPNGSTDASLVTPGASVLE